MKKPLCIDLFCGLGGWAEGFLAEGWDVIGFDIERHDYGTGGYPGQLVLQDVLTIHGAQFREAWCIVASPPCQAYSYRAMPWKRAKALPPPDNTLFQTCFRIQREASAAARRRIPLLVENVRGAQRWVGRAPYHYGSFYLWGSLEGYSLPTPRNSIKNGGGASWFPISHGKRTHHGSYGKNPNRGPGIDGVKQHGSGPIWFDRGIALLPSSSPRRKAASAKIAKIPFELSSHIARCFKPDLSAVQVHAGGGQ